MPALLRQDLQQCQALGILKQRQRGTSAAGVVKDAGRIIGSKSSTPINAPSHSAIRVRNTVRNCRTLPGQANASNA